MKKLLSFLLTFALALSLLPGAALAAETPAEFDRFRAENTYYDGRFSDVSAGDWYADWVAESYSLGLMQGASAQRFQPGGDVTLGEAVALAARIHSIYYATKKDFRQGEPWYQTYVDYAVSYGILKAGAYADYTAPATRGQFAMILAAALPDEGLAVINPVDNGLIPDVGMTAPWAAAVYRLYRAGVLTGKDKNGSFGPNDRVTRAAAAAVAVRLARPELRQTLSLTEDSLRALTAEQIYAQCTSAVFYIELYDKDGEAVGTGSGFFLTADGRAVTNYHVISKGYTAKATTVDGRVYDISGIYSYNADKDVALIQVAGKDFNYLPADSAAPAAGQTVYTIGCPLGLSNSISSGIVSNSYRVQDGIDYIQISAPISQGSSGGALIDAAGQVIGVTTGSYVYGENMNLAVPIRYALALSHANLSPISTLYVEPEPEEVIETKQYEDCPEVPDLGALLGLEPWRHETGEEENSYYYLVDDIMELDPGAVFVVTYQKWLQANGFENCGYYWSEYGFLIQVNQNEEVGLMVTWGETVLDGEKCEQVKITPLKDPDEGENNA